QLTPPGDIWMRRAYKPSQILGAPYFELSTYVFKLWFAAYDHGDFSLKPRQDLHLLYLNVAESFTRSVGVSGVYTEPTQQQIASHKVATNLALSHALALACQQIHGRIEGTICHF